jgi:hypothetical protein
MREERLNIEERREEKFYVLTLTVAAKCFLNIYKEIPPSQQKTTEELNGRLEYQGNLSATFLSLSFRYLCVRQTDNELWRDSILC